VICLVLVALRIL